MKAKLRYLLIGVLTAIVAAAALLFTPLGKGPLSTLFPVGSVERVDFAYDRSAWPHLFDDFVDQSVVERFLGRHESVTIGVFFDFFQRVAGVF